MYSFGDFYSWLFGMTPAAEEQHPIPEKYTSPAFPDFLLDPNAVLKDDVKWRYGNPPNYTKTRTFFQETKSKDHKPGSLEFLTENLVKNWEIEASFKTSLDEWRTMDLSKYKFHINGGPGQTGEEMLEVGTYNAIITSNEFYDPAYSDFSSSHKTFKRMMPAFAWEVLEVYSGPPVVSFRWRHWGEMLNDYVGFNDKGEKVTARAHGGPIDIQGVTTAYLAPDFRIQKLETWFDPLEMFRQIAPKGIINKEPRRGEATPGELLDFDPKLADLQRVDSAAYQNLVPMDEEHRQSIGIAFDRASSEGRYEPGEAHAAAPHWTETHAMRDEMRSITPNQCPFMNGE